MGSKKISLHRVLDLLLHGSVLFSGELKVSLMFSRVCPGAC